MTIEAIVAKWGVAAVFAGAAVEGEAAVTAGGLLAHQHLLWLPAVMLAAAAGSFSADQAWFAFGRRFRDHRWVKNAQKKPAFARVIAAVEKRPKRAIFFFRFIYGLRTISPIAIGTTQISHKMFAAVNGASAVTWAVIFSAIGYLFGTAFEEFGAHLKHGPALWWVVGGLVVAGAIWALYRHVRSRD